MLKCGICILNSYKVLTSVSAMLKLVKSDKFLATYSFFSEEKFSSLNYSSGIFFNVFLLQARDFNIVSDPNYLFLLL